MNTLELLFAMYRDVGMRVQGGGVWPADALIHLKCKRPSFFIVNTSEGNNIGTHWVALYLPEKGPFEFFDPLGHPPEHYHAYFKFFLLGFGYSWNRVAYQAPYSVLCGEYCLYFGYYRCRNMSMRHVLETLRLGDDDQMYTFYSHTFQKV